jgi:hypothetical protein
LLHVDAVGWIMIHVKSEEEGEQNPADTRDGNHNMIIYHSIACHLREDRYKVTTLYQVPYQGITEGRSKRNQAF